MAKTTLSKIHALIQNHSEEINRLWININVLKNTFSYRIFEKTTQADLDAIKEKLRAENKKFYDMLAEIRKHSDYIAYLKSELQKGNNRHGVSELLLAVKNTDKRINIIHSAMEKVVTRSSAFINIDNVHAVDFYQSAFTENNRTYDLVISAFPTDAALPFQQELEREEKKIRELKDSIAAINQTRSVNIADYADFKSGE